VKIFLCFAFLLTSCNVATFPQGGSFQSQQERKLADLFRGNARQKRPVMIYDQRLARAARAKAYDMARRGYFAHVDPDGNGANVLISRTGYRLPPIYLTSRELNFVESLAGGHDTAEETYQQFLTSALHRRHLLGENPVYAAQTRIGVGYAYVPDSKVVHYWAVLTAPAEVGR